MPNANHKTKTGRVRDFLLYCLIGLLVAGIAVLIGFYQAKAVLPATSSLKWVGFSGMTAFAFGYVIRYSRRFWRQSRFWWVLALLLALHLGLGFLIVPKLAGVRL